MASLNDICYEQIENNFYYGIFEGLKFVVDKNTSCFNATNLCNDNCKKLKEWARLETSKKIIKLYEKNIYDVKSNLSKTTGRYFPVGLFISLISWLKLPKPINLEGVIYIITNSMLQVNNVYKISYTQNFQHSLNSLNEHRHSSEPQYFAAAVYNSKDARKLEIIIYKKLCQYRTEGKFFELPLESIKKAFEDEDCYLVQFDYEENHNNLFMKDNINIEEFKKMKL